MKYSKTYTIDDAKRIGDILRIDWKILDLEQFKIGLNIELEHGFHDLRTNVSDNDDLVTGKIVWAHLNEFPDYYMRLEKMEEEAKKFWGKKD